MTTSKTSRTPISTTLKLSKDESGTKIDENIYYRMIRSLLYLTASRPDLCLSVVICARYQACPKESHLAAAKWIIKYVKTLNYGLHYKKTPIKAWLDTMTRIRVVIWMTGKALLGALSSWATTSFHGIVRIRIARLYPLLRLNTSP